MKAGTEIKFYYCKLEKPIKIHIFIAYLISYYDWVYGFILTITVTYCGLTKQLEFADIYKD